MDSKQIQSSDVVVGKILWLPPFEELPAGSVQSVGQTPTILEEACDHPVVICSRPAIHDGEYVHFHIVTSFHNRSLAEKFNIRVDRQRRRVHWYLPIAPSEYHHQNIEPRLGHPRIELEDGLKMPSNSFINAKDIYSIKWDLLTRFQGGRSHRLTASSIEHMHERTGRLVRYKLEAQHSPPAVENMGETSSPPIRVAHAPRPRVPLVETLPPLAKWTRIDVMTPFNLAGGTTAVIFVGTIASGTSDPSQALCIIPKHNVQVGSDPQAGSFVALEASLRTFGRMMRRAVSWLWERCGRRRTERDGCVSTSAAY